MSPARIRDISAAIVLFVIGLVIVLFVIPRGVQVPETVKSAALSPDFWPKIIGYSAVAAAFLMLVEAFGIQPIEQSLTQEETRRR